MHNRRSGVAKPEERGLVHCLFGSFAQKPNKCGFSRIRGLDGQGADGCARSNLASKTHVRGKQGFMVGGSGGNDKVEETNLHEEFSCSAPRAHVRVVGTERHSLPLQTSRFVNWNDERLKACFAG